MSAVDLPDPHRPAPDTDGPAPITPVLITIGSDDVPVCTDGACAL